MQNSSKNIASGIEISFDPAYPGDSPLDKSMFPQLWCPNNGTFSAYGILFFQPIDQVRFCIFWLFQTTLNLSCLVLLQTLSTLIQFQSEIGQIYYFDPVVSNKFSLVCVCVCVCVCVQSTGCWVVIYTWGLSRYS